MVHQQRKNDMQTRHFMIITQFIHLQTQSILNSQYLINIRRCTISKNLIKYFHIFFNCNMVVKENSLDFLTDQPSLCYTPRSC